MAPAAEVQMANGRLRRSVGIAGLLGISLAVGLCMAEFTLRLVLPTPEGYFVYPPGLRREVEAAPGVMPGVSGISRFFVNSQGLRGDEVTPAHTYRVLAVGGSTTQCLYLDQAEAWPSRLQELLTGTGAPRHRAWVGNAGKPGRPLPAYRLQLERLLEAIPRLDVVVILVGANDVNRRLNLAENFEPLDLSEPRVRAQVTAQAFDVYPSTYAMVPLDRTALWSLALRVRRAIHVRRHWQMIQDRAGRNYQIWRANRARATRIRRQLPDLHTALEAYRSDLDAVLALGEKHRVRIVFMTQPFIYREDLPDETRKLLWMGWVGQRQSDPGQEYYSVEVLAQTYDAFNATLLEFCQESGAECLDLEPLIAKDTRSFYDDIHFNETGSEAVAQIVFHYLSSSSPSAADEEGGSLATARD